jgi:hypothetical protein
MKDKIIQNYIEELLPYFECEVKNQCYILHSYVKINFLNEKLKNELENILKCQVLDQSSIKIDFDMFKIPEIYKGLKQVDRTILTSIKKSA